LFEFLGHKWGDPEFGTPSGTISWDANLNGLTPAGDATVDQLESALQSAFTTWENVADVDFVQVSGNADVLIGDTTFGLGSTTLAAATISDLSNFSEPTVADIEFNSDVFWAPTTDPNVISENFFAVALHEIGHILGLEHVDDPTQIMNAFLTADDLGGGDIQGIQALYGTDDTDDAVAIAQEDVDGAVERATAGSDDGGGGGGFIAGLLLGLVALVFGSFTGGAGLAVVAASRTLDDEDDMEHGENGVEVHLFGSEPHDHGDEHDHHEDDQIREGFLPALSVEPFAASQPLFDDEGDEEVFLL